MINKFLKHFLNLGTMGLYAYFLNTTITSHGWWITRPWITRILYAQSIFWSGSRFFQAGTQRWTCNGFYSRTIRNTGDHSAHRSHTARAITYACIRFARGIGYGNAYKWNIVLNNSSFILIYVVHKPFLVLGSLKPGLFIVVADEGEAASIIMVGSPPGFFEYKTSYKANTKRGILKIITTI